MQMNRSVPVFRYPTNVTQVFTDASNLVQELGQVNLESSTVTRHVRDGDNVVQVEYGNQTVFVDLEEVISHWLKTTKPFG